MGTPLVAHPGGEHRDRTPDVVHRLTQPGRHLAGLRDGQRRPRRFGDVVLVLVVLTHAPIVLRAGGPDQGVRKCPVTGDLDCLPLKSNHRPQPRGTARCHGAGQPPGHDE
ncbi:hypothetical protein J7I98_39925 [Streptomyces sp. ISL-98]|uniref:hypothetical protein n=1 Tax=Streptomyces sp. ISL-98 TaxID=2819192 RepID=UPI001BEACACF|nr:hypothetical protein [Streptomyces sp. ISL-98]MBT2511826.1 hypothetical protein [Streptomyces sp. ISL-98]